jgi:2-keto-4-pentenoate hydratase
VLGRKSYTQEELDAARSAVEQQLVAYRTLADAAPAGSKAGAALADFEPIVFNRMVLVLDRYFVHRLRTVTGKDPNPLNEVELLTESLLNNDGVLRTGNVVRWVPEQSVLGLRAGDRIRLTADDFERLSTAFLAELERRFV